MRRLNRTTKSLRRPPPPQPATSNRRFTTRYPPLLLGRDHDHHDQRQNAEKQTEDAPAEWVAALGRCDQRAHDRRDNAADRDENSLDAAQYETCGLRLAVAGQQQLMKHDDLLDAERGTVLYPGVEYPDGPQLNCPAAGDAHELPLDAVLAVAQALDESPGFFPTGQQTRGAHVVQSGRGGVALGDQQLVPARPVDRQRRVGGRDGVFSLRAVLR